MIIVEFSEPFKEIIISNGSTLKVIPYSEGFQLRMPWCQIENNNKTLNHEKTRISKKQKTIEWFS